MVCHTVEFVMAVLQEKPYYPRMSAHLIQQLREVDCNEFSRVLRAIDASEAGAPRTKPPSDFNLGGVLSGYGHLHYLRSDWAAGNLASINRRPVGQSLDLTIDQLAKRIVEKEGDPQSNLENLMNKFSEGMARATGDWVIYEDCGADRRYLALAEHVKWGSPEELSLRDRLHSLDR
mgnify:CR=1 FL=1